jgi:hypothetical protein
MIAAVRGKGMVMEYTSQKIQATRGRVREQEVRLAQQRKKMEQAIADRHPADDLQASLLIMEQSLIAMARFLKILERDLRDGLSIQGYATRQSRSASRTGAEHRVPKPSKRLTGSH